MTNNTNSSRDLHADDNAEGLAPDFVAHWVVKTARAPQMIRWYSKVFGAQVVHEGSNIAFLSWDDESHRLALVKLPAALKYVFPLARFRRKAYGIDHIALTFGSLRRLLRFYARLKADGIFPVWAINHGPTTSLYYEDPDGIRLEFQTENFSTAAATADYLRSKAFDENPIGVNFDPDYLLEQLEGGADPDLLQQQGAGTRPGEKARANKRAISWKTL
jgi:catechol 2,3-dioxygenase-like lactoylglutathione lyase family enzyme